MDKYWMMPLLTTLAALVILVHSAEEDMEAEFQRTVGPKTVESAPHYEQTWRAIEVDSIPHPSQNYDIWDSNLPEQLPKRRRKYMRKQKRRPLTDINFEDNQEERSLYVDEGQRPVHDINIPAQEVPRRRRKRPEMSDNSWGDGQDGNRPIRRRGQRRKRPGNKHRSKSNDEVEETQTDQMEDKHETVDENTYVKQGDSLDEERAENNNRDSNTKHDEIDNQKEDMEPKIQEVMVVAESSETQQDTLYRNQGVQNDNSVIDKILQAKKNGSPIDPRTLKDLLKKSNGASLSEILQEHNLSLSDLLRGKENVNSGPPEEQNKNTDSETKIHQTIEDSIDKKSKITETGRNIDELFTTNNNNTGSNDAPKMMTRKRFMPGTRRKLRLKTPMSNQTMKFPITRNTSALITRKQALHKKFNVSEKPDISSSTSDLPPETTTIVKTTTTTTTTTEKMPEISTETIEIETSTTNAPMTTTDTIADFDFKSGDIETAQSTNLIGHQNDIIMINDTPHEKKIVTSTIATTEKSIVTTVRVRPISNNTELRRQALSNRLKRKRQKQKLPTNETPETEKQAEGGSSSASIDMETEMTKTSNTFDFKDVTGIDDGFVTEASTRVEKSQKVTKPYTVIRTASTRVTAVPTTTEEISKIEIAEILNDRSTGARLYRILKERNMTFDELKDHRERGSSNVHLADIFHNASREPNPPEPFLSKSSIEPISKEIYPLRALLEANLHDPTVKPTSIELNSGVTPSHQNIPIVMDYRSNVNENSENLGIMSLFNKLTNNDINVDETSVTRDSDGTPYVTSIVSVTVSNSTETVREGRGLHQNRDTVTLRDIFSLIHDTYKNETEDSFDQITKENAPHTSTTKISFNSDNDALIVLDELQQLKDLDNQLDAQSGETLELGYKSKNEHTIRPGILDKMPGTTKSVAVATASIVGLTMVVFLLTYAAFKWRQQRNSLRKKNSFCEENIPTPVFETRKGKINCSSRSISPMLPSSNIYTLSTLDSQNGKDSPDYMWDSLRKPFQ